MLMHTNSLDVNLNIFVEPPIRLRLEDQTVHHDEVRMGTCKTAPHGAWQMQPGACIPAHATPHMQGYAARDMQPGTCSRPHATEMCVEFDQTTHPPQVFALHTQVFFKVTYTDPAGKYQTPELV